MKSKRTLVWILFFLSLFLILALTLQNTEKSGMLSDQILDFLRWLESVTGSYKYGYSLKRLPAPTFRKFGHTAEYFLLGLTAMLLFRKSPKGFLKAVALCAVISVCDQSIKLFVPGREFDWTDFPYDMAGYVLGAALVSHHDRKKSKKAKRKETEEPSTDGSTEKAGTECSETERDKT